MLSSFALSAPPIDADVEGEYLPQPAGAHRANALCAK
jgi:hypothetical protein